MVQRAEHRGPCKDTDLVPTLLRFLLSIRQQHVFSIWPQCGWSDKWEEEKSRKSEGGRSWQLTSDSANEVRVMRRQQQAVSLLHHGGWEGGGLLALQDDIIDGFCWVSSCQLLLAHWRQQRSCRVSAWQACMAPLCVCVCDWGVPLSTDAAGCFYFLRQTVKKPLYFHASLSKEKHSKNCSLRLTWLFVILLIIELNYLFDFICLRTKILIINHCHFWLNKITTCVF